jgi:hypothetical protein
MSAKPNKGAVVHRSKFVQESQEAAQAASQHVTALTSALPEGLVRRNMPTMVKPGEIPVGTTISGEIVAFVDSPVSTVKGKLIWLRHQNGTEFTLPCTGVIRNALVPGKDGAELEKALEKEVGKMFYATRTPDKQNSKYKKSMFMFDVFTSAK